MKKQRVVECPLPVFPAAGRRPEPPKTAGRVPRLSRLLALALRLDEQVRSGAIRNYTELAHLGHVSRARISQILNLLLLAPDIQEEILFLPNVERGREPLRLRQVLPITAVACWRQQRRLWQELKCGGSRPLGEASATGTRQTVMQRPR